MVIARFFHDNQAVSMLSPRQRVLTNAALVLTIVRFLPTTNQICRLARLSHAFCEASRHRSVWTALDLSASKDTGLDKTLALVARAGQMLQILRLPRRARIGTAEQLDRLLRSLETTDVLDLGLDCEFGSHLESGRLLPRLINLITSLALARKSAATATAATCVPRAVHLRLREVHLQYLLSINYESGSFLIHDINDTNDSQALYVNGGFLESQGAPGEVYVNGGFLEDLGVWLRVHYKCKRQYRNTTSPCGASNYRHHWRPKWLCDLCGVGDCCKCAPRQLPYHDDARRRAYFCSADCVCEWQIRCGAQ